MKKKKNILVAVAMSGGVDSSVAALLLKKQGYRAVGLTMQLVDCGQEKISGCCGIEAVNSAQKVCQKLSIPHYVVNFKQSFKKCVVDNFIKEYQGGRTPNPCVTCNEKIKFGLLLRRARELGAEYLATGHYAQIRIKNNESRIMNYGLIKGVDKNKDQSYFLYRLNQKQLKHILFPLGNLTKSQVRQIAQRAGLPTANRPESQEICFIPDNNYRYFLRQSGIKQKPGLIVDKKNKILGRHQGLFQYTVGQRKGLGQLKIKNQKSKIKITNQKSKIKESGTLPYYVIKVDAKRNKLVVGPEKDLYQKKCSVKSVNWISEKAPNLPIKIKAKIRYRHEAVPAVITKNLKFIIYNLKFARPQRAITPGQSAVFYLGRRVLGGGIIEAAID